MLALAHNGLCSLGLQTSTGGRSLICGSHGLLMLSQLLHLDWLNPFWWASSLTVMSLCLSLLCTAGNPAAFQGLSSQQKFNTSRNVTLCSWLIQLNFYIFMIKIHANQTTIPKADIYFNSRCQQSLVGAWTATRHNEHIVLLITVSA